MALLEVVCDKLQDMIDSNCSSVSNVKISLGSRNGKFYLPKVLVHDGPLIVFVRFEDFQKSGDKELSIVFRRVLNYLAEKLELSINSFMLYGYCEGSESFGTEGAFCSFNSYNDRIIYYSGEEDGKCFIESVLDELSYRKAVFSSEEVSALAFNLEMMTGSNGNVKCDNSGNYYIKKHGQWFLVSDKDPEEVFSNMAVFGFFGAHKFAEKKRLSGLIYLLTCGFFGVGWFLDCISMFLGIYKDKEGKYVLPVADKKQALRKMCTGLAIGMVYAFILIFTLKFLSTTLSDVAENVIINNRDKLDSLPRE